VTLILKNYAKLKLPLWSAYDDSCSPAEAAAVTSLF